MSPLRIGVVGAGVFGRRHVGTVRSVPACELAVIADLAPEAAAWAREQGIRCFTNAAPWNWELASGENPVYPRRDENCYYFAGTEGSLALPALELWRYEGKKGWHAPLSRRTLEVERADPQLRQLQHFCRVICDGEDPRVSGEDAIRTLAVVHAVQEAAQTGRAVVI